MGSLCRQRDVCTSERKRQVGKGNKQAREEKSGIHHEAHVLVAVQAQPSPSPHACAKMPVWPDRGLSPLSLGTDSSSRSPRSAVSLCGTPQRCDERQKAPGTPEFWSLPPPVPSGCLWSPSASASTAGEVRQVQNEGATKLERPVRTHKGCQ